MAAGANTSHINRPLAFTAVEPTGRERSHAMPMRPITTGASSTATPRICSRMSERYAPTSPGPVVRRANSGAAAHGVQRRVGGVVGDQREEKEDGGDEDDQPQHLVEAAASCRGKYESLGLHGWTGARGPPSLRTLHLAQRRPTDRRTIRALLLFHGERWDYVPP